MLKLSRNNQNINMLGVPPNTLPLVIYIFCYWVLLHYNMSFKTIAGGFNGAFWWYGPLSENLEFLKQIYQNYLVALNPNCIQWVYCHSAHPYLGIIWDWEQYVACHRTYETRNILLTDMSICFCLFVFCLETTWNWEQSRVLSKWKVGSWSSVCMTKSNVMIHTVNFSGCPFW